MNELHASDFTISGKTIVDDFIFQLDDCHKLSRMQLDFLRQELVETRISNTVWLAMRYDKFTYEELMPKTDMIGRDYNSIHLGTDNKFEKMLGSIMEKRSNLSRHDIKLNNSLEQLSILSDDQYQTIIDYSRKALATKQGIGCGFGNSKISSDMSHAERSRQLITGFENGTGHRKNLLMVKYRIRLISLNDYESHSFSK